MLFPRGFGPTNDGDGGRGSGTACTGGVTRFVPGGTGRHDVFPVVISAGCRGADRPRNRVRCLPGGSVAEAESLFRAPVSAEMHQRLAV